MCGVPQFVGCCCVRSRWGRAAGMAAGPAPLLTHPPCPPPHPVETRYCRPPSSTTRLAAQLLSWHAGLLLTRRRNAPRVCTMLQKRAACLVVRHAASACRRLTLRSSDERRSDSAVAQLLQPPSSWTRHSTLLHRCTSLPLPAAIPGLLPEEMVAPVADSVGIRLLQKMGWRQGKGIGELWAGRGAGRRPLRRCCSLMHAGRCTPTRTTVSLTLPPLPLPSRAGVGGDAPTAADDAAEDEAGAGGGGGGGGRRRRWGQHVSVAADNTSLYLLAPKTDVHGLGFDPFKGAEDFRALKEAARGKAAPKAVRGCCSTHSGVGGRSSRGAAPGLREAGCDDGACGAADTWTRVGADPIGPPPPPPPPLACSLSLRQSGGGASLSGRVRRVVRRGRGRAGLAGGGGGGRGSKT